MTSAGQENVRGSPAALPGRRRVGVFIEQGEPHTARPLEDAAAQISDSWQYAYEQLERGI